MLCQQMKSISSLENDISSTMKHLRELEHQLDGWKKDVVEMRDQIRRASRGFSAKKRARWANDDAVRWTGGKSKRQKTLDKVEELM